MSVNPSDIVEKQLQLLLDQSNKGTLTFEEFQSLERLVKMQILLRLKGNNRSAAADPYDDISSDDLKRMLPLLEE